MINASPMFILALPAHHINQLLLKKQGQRHGDDIEMKTYHLTFAPRSLCHCHWKTIQREGITIRPNWGPTLRIVFIDVWKDMKLGLQFKGVVICVDPRMLVIWMIVCNKYVNVSISRTWQFNVGMSKYRCPLWKFVSSFVAEALF